MVNLSTYLQSIKIVLRSRILYRVRPSINEVHTLHFIGLILTSDNESAGVLPAKAFGVSLFDQDS